MASAGQIRCADVHLRQQVRRRRIRTSREAILAQLRKRLIDAIYPLPAMEQSTEGSAVPLDALAEDIATLDEEAMNDYLEHGALSVGRLRAMIAVRELFPVYFGSALKLEGAIGADGLEIPP